MAGETKRSNGSQGHRSKGQGHGGRDHEHRGKGRSDRTTIVHHQKQNTAAKKPATAAADVSAAETTDSDLDLSLDNCEFTVLESGGERVMIRQDRTSGGDAVTEETTDRNHSALLMGDWNDNASHHDHRPQSRPTHDNFDVKSFNCSLDEFVQVLSDPRYQDMHPDYPVDDLMSVVSMVSATIEEYEEHSKHTQSQLSQLRNTMRNVKENLHLSTTRQPFDRRTEEGQTAEELETKAQLTKLHAVVAEAHSSVAEASRLSAEAQQMALEASLAAQQARHEAERIQEEIKLKEEMEKKKAEEERKHQEEEEKRLKEEAKRKKVEEERAKELSRHKLEEIRKTESERSMYEHWPPLIYTIDQPEGTELLCIIRANPAHFQQADFTCEIIIQDDQFIVHYGDQEELLSKILTIKCHKTSRQHITEPIYIAVPYMVRLPPSREAVVKTLTKNQWEVLVTQDVNFDGHKEYRFAQARVEDMATAFLVMSRYKRDYLTVVQTHYVTKLMSSYDARVVLTIPKDTFRHKEHVVLQLQPVDSFSVSEFRAQQPRNKALLTSSPILHMEWEYSSFVHPINVMLPCPPNPAKAKTMALLKKQKEERMKAPAIKPILPEEPEKEKVKKSAGKGKTVKIDLDQDEPGPPPPRQNKWYMGQYGQTEDDENDKLCFMCCNGERWMYEPEVEVIQAKTDLVTFMLQTAHEKVAVFRTKPDVEADTLRQMATDLTHQLTRRSVKILVRQRAEDPYDVCCHLVPTSGLERAERILNAEGYIGTEEYTTNLCEGDRIMLELRGNLKFQELEEPIIKLFYNSNIPTQASFSVIEKDKYLQRNYQEFRGALRVVREYYIIPHLKRRMTWIDQSTSAVTKTDIVCEIDIEIPKYHLEPDPIPKKVPMVLQERGPVSLDTLRHVAEELGDEWLRLAEKLHIDRVRIQAILRTAQASDGTANEEDARYQMLLTWLKRCPHSADKLSILSSALMSVGRSELAIQLDSRKAHRRSIGHLLRSHQTPSFT